MSSKAIKDKNDYYLPIDSFFNIINNLSKDFSAALTSQRISFSAKKITVTPNKKVDLSNEKQKWEFKTIVIDAGHGGKDPGAVGYRGTKEKDIALDVAKRLEKKLSKNLNVKIVMTRDEDIFLRLSERTKIANENNGSLFISIHTNAAEDRRASGFETFLIGPNKNLKISSLDHGAMTGKMIWKIENFLKKKKYDCILLYGDTNSTLAAAIACKKLNIKIAHIEAGIRSYNMNMPEEINRVLTDRVSDFLFCPTKSSVIKLKKEGITNRVYFTGDVMLDTYLDWKKHSNTKLEKKHIFFTLHRPYNTDNKIRLKKILKIVDSISKKNKTISLLHPRTKKNIKNFSLLNRYNNITFSKSTDYYKTLELIANAQCVITDSGGIQKEAYFMKKPCLTIRSETEWPETIKFGYNKLIFNKLDEINEIIKFNYFKNKNTYQKSILVMENLQVK